MVDQRTRRMKLRIVAFVAAVLLLEVPAYGQ